MYEERRVLGVKVGYDDLVLDLKCIFESLTRYTLAMNIHPEPSLFSRTFWSTFGKWSALRTEDEKVRMSLRVDGSRSELSIYCSRVLPFSVGFGV